MKVCLMCFGKYNGINVRSSPYELQNNVIDFLPKYSVIEVEHVIYNENWFKIRDREAFIMMWFRTEDGLIDYAFNRAQLKSFQKKSFTLPSHAENSEDVLKKELKNDVKTDSVFDTSLNKGVENMTIKEDKDETKESDSKRKGRYKKEKIPATVRNIVWVTHFGSSKKGSCWLCKVEDISSANFECGHVISEKNGGKPSIDNLRPICSFCNKSVGTMNMEDFKIKYNIP